MKLFNGDIESIISSQVYIFVTVMFKRTDLSQSLRTTLVDLFWFIALPMLSNSDDSNEKI